jgi:hypothetical protein
MTGIREPTFSVTFRANFSVTFRASFSVTFRARSSEQLLGIAFNTSYLKKTKKKNLQFLFLYLKVGFFVSRAWGIKNVR